MGTWDVDAFGNDDAADWVFGLEKSRNLSLVEGTIEKALKTQNEYLEAPDAAEALAAVEVLARLKGNWGVRNPYTESADRWVAEMKLLPPPELVSKGRRAIERILSNNSELEELWKESGDYELWLESARNLQSRLTD